MSTTETTAGLLRRAAKTMRERAEAATQGPWWPVAGIWQAETFAAVIGPKGVPEDAETWLMATGRGAVCQEADADHAASWHPLVAADFAAVLEAAADEMDADHRDGLMVTAAVLKAVRTYLDETPERSRHREHQVSPLLVGRVRRLRNASRVRRLLRDGQ